MEKIDDDWTATDVLKRVLIFRRVKLFELSFYFLFLHGETAELNGFSFGQRNRTIERAFLLPVKVHRGFVVVIESPERGRTDL